MQTETLNEVNQMFGEMANLLLKYERGGSLDDLVLVSREYIKALGPTISMQCMQASSARYLASLGNEFRAHVIKTDKLLDGLAQPNADTNKIAKEIGLEIKEFQKFLLENGLISAKIAQLSRSVQKNIETGDIRGQETIIRTMVQQTSALPKDQSSSLKGIVSFLKAASSLFFKMDINFVPRIIGTVLLINLITLLVFPNIGNTIAAALNNETVITSILTIGFGTITGFTYLLFK